MCLHEVLLDKGCSTTIYDSDEVEEIGLIIDRKNGRPRRMYGVGGESELCYEQIVFDIKINDYYSLQIIIGNKGKRTREL